MKIKIFVTILISVFYVITLPACTKATPPTLMAPEYYSPLPNAEYVSSRTTIILRYGPALNAHNMPAVKISTQGVKSGPHAGQTILADDGKTVIFRPNQPFIPGEQVNVTIDSFQLNSQTSYKPLAYSFSIATNQQPGGPASQQAGSPPNPPHSAFPNFLTLPQDIPHYTILKTSPEAAPGDIFVAPFFWTKSTLGSYLLILNNQGQIVYYQSMAEALIGFDFKVQPNGTLSYFDQKDATFYVLDSHYKVVDTYQAGDGYTADLHDLQILPDGNALLMAYDNETIDMSKYVLGGQKDATVTGLIIQELDPSKNVIFEWRSWDHFAFTDSTSVLTEQNIDLVHGNALALANDGNLLLSSRNQSEITKINLQTGEIIWRFGGKANIFQLVNGEPFAYQHDVRQLPDGDITVFDNQGTEQAPDLSHAIEYRLDETNHIATQVWEYTHEPPVFATYMGNNQRLDNGNTFLDWGAPYVKSPYVDITMSEVTPDNQIVFEMVFDRSYVSYRAFRFPWKGYPDTLPALAYKADETGILLGYSWNGATEVASYRVYGGSSAQSLNLIEERTKADFETQSHLDNLSPGECYFQVAALDSSGKELARSKVISTDNTTCPLNP